MRKPWFLAVLVIVALAAPSFAQDPWKEFSSKEGRFIILMPGTPKVSKEKITNPGKLPADQYQYLVEAENGAYLVSYQDEPSLAQADQKKINAAFDAARNRLIATFEGKAQVDRAITLEKYPGRQLTITAPKLQGIYHTRIYLVDGRLYQVIAIGSPAFAQSKDIELFFNSFKLAAK